jgi:uncharacterized lipoprotein YajG
MKSIILIPVFVLAGCAASPNYKIYADQTTKIQQAAAASEAACFLVLAEAIKTANDSAKAMISGQIDRCKRETPRIEAPRKNWLGF